MPKRREQPGKSLQRCLMAVSKELVALIRRLALPLLILLVAGSAAAQTTAFTYQGKLTDSGNLANGNYDFQFALFDTVSNGTQIGTTQALSNITVTNGAFIVTLDFGACPTCFNGSPRFLQISLRPAGSPNPFFALSPRQQISSTPYAVKSLSAATAD